MSKSVSPFDSVGFLKHVTAAPGVYRMLDRHGEILYIGKASNLKKRLGSYFRTSGLPAKTRAMMQHMASIDMTVTHTETEALLLENNLIKQHKPRYNVILRDDKSYPYIHLDLNRPFPRLTVYRGRRRESGQYYGPYPSAHAARETVNLLQKLFLLRQCNDIFFKNRSRPCLQYQIRHCSAPCVQLISREDYAHDVHHAVLFLEGRTREVIDEMVSRMQNASERQDFELAARYRDQIASLRNISGRQHMSAEQGDYDVIAAAQGAGTFCIAVMLVRGGHNLGSRTFYPKITGETSLQEVLAAFLPQYYLGQDIPKVIMTPIKVMGATLLQNALSDQSGRRVRIRHPQRGDGMRLLALTQANARQALNLHLAMDADLRERFESLQEILRLQQLPTRLECFDISHTMGEGTVASCVVFDSNGPLKGHYRRFNIDGIAPGDDYGALHQALSRRYTRLKKGEGVIPDVLVIDGGKGQLHEAEKVLEELQVEGVMLVGISKGPTRKAGMEQIFLSGRESPLILPSDSLALHLFQQIRDEAHRFAITGHRQRRARARTTSVLESIPGVGAKRRQQLMKQFGGLQGVSRAGIEDLASVHGISRELAGRIYELLHGD
ncbi:MAG: excinuclease ABC subunit UvrC [Gammaproteobacteria bacterium]|nr:excinuclease ABC subunit UvrC [Gammaproteobacteria bacterium]